MNGTNTMNQIIEQLKEAVTQFSPNLLGALLVLVVGWIIALLAAALTRRLLRRTQFDNKLAQWVAGKEAPPNLPVEAWAAGSYSTPSCCSCSWRSFKP